MILIIMLVAIFAFIFGFLSGYIVESSPKVCKKETRKEQFGTELQKEYENFLNYDGTVQE